MSTAVQRTMPDSLIITCVTDHPKAMLLLRAARRQAQARGCHWRALFIETPAQLKQDEAASRQRMLRLLTLAEQMDAQVVQLDADSIEQGLQAQLEKEVDRVALVILGGVEKEGWLGRWRNRKWQRRIRIAQCYAPVEVVMLSGHSYRRTWSEWLHLRSIRPMYLLYALASVSVAYIFAYGLQSGLPPALFRLNDQNIGLLFMIACAFVAGRYGLLPGLVASVASFLTVNYYFTVPYHELKITTVTDAINMVLFLAAALLISVFTSQTRGYAQKAAQRELSTQALFSLYRIASDAFSRDQALKQLQHELERMLDVDVALFLPDAPESPQLKSAFPAGLALEEADRRALDACWAEMKTTGVASPYNPGTAWRFEPMISPAGEIGAIGVRPRGRTRLDPWFGRLLTAIADQTAAVLEHIDLERSMEATRLREEREKLRSMLLSSVSHDFKTPLAGIIGALSVHRSLGERLTPQKRAELIEAAIEEAQRLDSFITNILDMTRLESGNIQFKPEWHRVADMIDSVTKRLRQRCRQHEVVVTKLPAAEAFMDVMMTEQVLQNILDNACKYTPPGTRIEIGCTADAQGLRCQVRDHGAGLPPEKLSRVFDKYARLQKKDTQVAGTGLGLAISKAVMEAQGGWITAGNHPGGGAVFTLCLREWRAMAQADTNNGAIDAPYEQAYSGH